MKISLSEIRSMARADLAGKWSNAVLLTLVYMLVYIPVALLARESSLLNLALQFSFVMPFAWGMNIAYLSNVRGTESPFTLQCLLEGFKDYFRVAETMALQAVYITLWTILLLVPYNFVLTIVGVVVLVIKTGAADPSVSKDAIMRSILELMPSGVNPLMLVCIVVFVYLVLMLPGLTLGIVKSLSYAATPYILKDNPELKNNGAIELSMKMMDGHKMDLFLLSLSFIGWGFLCILTLGIGLLWLIPYIQASTARFYEQVKAEYEQKNVG